MASTLRTAVLRHIRIPVHQTLALDGSKLGLRVTVRSMSSHGDERLSKEDVTERVLDVVNSFPKVDSSKSLGILRFFHARK